LKEFSYVTTIEFDDDRIREHCSILTIFFSHPHDDEHDATFSRNVNPDNGFVSLHAMDCITYTPAAVWSKFSPPKFASFPMLIMAAEGAGTTFSSEGDDIPSEGGDIFVSCVSSTPSSS
jgi:hypothetical protein